MTREDIARMAWDACIVFNEAPEELEHFAALVAAAEREACAQECIEQLAKWNADKSDVNVARGCARAIRARGKK
jgi:hypothetical protein